MHLSKRADVPTKRHNCYHSGTKILRVCMAEMRLLKLEAEYWHHAEDNLQKHVTATSSSTTVEATCFCRGDSWHHKTSPVYREGGRGDKCSDRRENSTPATQKVRSGSNISPKTNWYPPSFPTESLRGGSVRYLFASTSKWARKATNVRACFVCAIVRNSTHSTNIIRHPCMVTLSLSLDRAGVTSVGARMIASHFRRTVNDHVGAFSENGTLSGKRMDNLNATVTKKIFRCCHTDQLHCDRATRLGVMQLTAMLQQSDRRHRESTRP